jgi:hypothetical protein
MLHVTSLLLYQHMLHVTSLLLYRHNGRMSHAACDKSAIVPAHAQCQNLSISRYWDWAWQNPTEQVLDFCRAEPE